MAADVTRTTHQSAGFIVVQIHDEAEIASAFGRVDELSRKLVAELDVVRTAAPLPVEAVRTTVIPVVACTGLDLALGTGAGDRVGDAGRGERVDEGRLSATYKRSAAL